MEVMQAIPGRLQEEARRSPPLCMLWPKSSACMCCAVTPQVCWLHLGIWSEIAALVRVRALIPLL